jgi:hypothetical protein
VNRSQLLAGVLAVVGPLLVLKVCHDLVMSWRDLEEWTAERNAGRVFNAKVIDGGAVAAIERLLETRDPDVIVLGPSYANTDVRIDLLAARLGISKDEIAMMSVPNSTGAHWYTMLKYRVYGGGYRPKLVVVVSGLQSMLLTTPLTESSYVNLFVQLPVGGDPFVASKVDHSLLSSEGVSAGGLWWARMREQRGKVRTWWFDQIRDLAATTVLPVNRAQVRTALNRVFDDANIDMRLHGASTPVVEVVRGPESYYTPDLLPSPEGSFIGDVTALVSEHGGRVVWVRPPMSPHVPDELDDVVLPGVQEHTIRLVEEKGGSFVDMRSLPMTSAMFKDEDHMNTEGSRRFSEALANALIELDALHPAAGPGGPPPLQVQTTGLSDDGWVQPGATATWTVADWEPVRGTFGCDLFLQATSLQGVVATMNGAVAPLQAKAVPGTGLLRANADTSSVPAPQGPFTITLSVPSDGAPVQVLALALGRKLRRTFVVGDAETLAGRSVRLMGVTRVVDGVLIDDSIHPTYLAPITRVPGHDRKVVDLPDEDAAVFETENWAFLSDEALMGESAYGSRCSPLRVTENGKLLPMPNVPCTDVKRKGRGRSCHTTDRIFFSAPDGTDPAHNGRTYRLVLDEARRCDGSAWIYPTDKFEVAFPPAQLSELVEGARWLTLGAKYLNFRESMLLVKLTVDGAVRLDTAIDGRQLKLGPKIWPLDPPILPTAREVVLTIENTGHVFYLVQEITLSEREPGG